MLEPAITESGVAGGDFWKSGGGIDVVGRLPGIDRGKLKRGTSKAGRSCSILGLIITAQLSAGI